MADEEGDVVMGGTTGPTVVPGQPPVAGGTATTITSTGGALTVTATIASSNRTSTQAAVPRDALILDEILRQMGVTEYNPRVVAQLLEFTHRKQLAFWRDLLNFLVIGQVMEILQDACDYKDHAGKKDLDIEDVKVAVSSRDALSIVDPPAREVLQRLAKQCNGQPLPMINEDRFGVRIPEERYCFTNSNYVVMPNPATPTTPPPPPANGSSN
jgi:hypothetical protein